MELRRCFQVKYPGEEVGVLPGPCQARLDFHIGIRTRQGLIEIRRNRIVAEASLGVRIQRIQLVRDGDVNEIRRRRRFLLTGTEQE